ncbi:MAG TPA: YihA family ribosome biogenesis GTP-binding protein [Rhodospirillaceae bacterium]|nr:YihA family ribosome biogenesis GTP-binding protein [Alphaproteobacteria bacterium]OUT39171.1 MAG: YihA family ribosome biogenesis GTP-binding protein [Micavibrio sp. TMED2]HCI46124.1 YihA family ribosome biogenesis GTP-binding protein [Rhodospirillaceae bacterium]MAS48513.1 YihA family ribosome biogenesis GTP-binding protein [Alphaproteobacteria bacterium]MAX96229.1 YihA family ribosome biogenesis GTP-binding protein [Alphaproteobacteria bacterium]|tara:strand:- start:10762 stop:11424 length:663 start_codon:yes stop_codon:yes gene_type:complete
MKGDITPSLITGPEGEAIEAGRKLFTGPCDFMLSVVNLDQLPVEGVPEIAFAGRSNVGKSSLINALTARGTIARTSNTPGRTQALNFFDLGGQMRLVDMPGYGYAKVSKSVVDAWTRLLKDYLRGRVPLRRVCVLIDSRHGIKENDTEILKLLDGSAVPYQVILTKIDKIKKGDAERRHAETVEKLVKHPAAHPEVISSSSEKGIGIEEIRASLAMLADS